MGVPILKHMYSKVYVVTDGEIILDIFSEEEQAKQYVEMYSDADLLIIPNTVEILVGDDDEKA